MEASWPASSPASSAEASLLASWGDLPAPDVPSYTLVCRSEFIEGDMPLIGAVDCSLGSTVPSCALLRLAAAVVVVGPPWLPTLDSECTPLDPSGDPSDVNRFTSSAPPDMSTTRGCLPRGRSCFPRGGGVCMPSDRPREDEVLVVLVPEGPPLELPVVSVAVPARDPDSVLTADTVSAA